MRRVEWDDEPDRFRFMLDGEPVVGMNMVATPEGSRYRDNQMEIIRVTDNRGVVTIERSGPGLYLLEALVEKQQSGGDIAMRYYNYFLTMKVLAP